MKHCAGSPAIRRCFRHRIAADTRKALTATVATLLEQDERPPTPAMIGRRTQQVNVRLTAEERLLLDAVAKRKGYSGMSDFIRAVAVEATR